MQSQATVYEASGSAGASPERQEPTTPAKTKAAATEEGGWLRFLLPLLDLGLLLAGAICTLGAVAIAVSLPARSAVLIKAASSGALTIRGVASVLGAVQLQATLRVLASLFLITAGDRTKRRLKRELFRAVLAQELGFVSERRPSGLVANLSEDTDKVGRAVAMQLSLAVNSIGGVIGGITRASSPSSPHPNPNSHPTPTLTLTLTPTRTLRLARAGIYQLFQLSPQLTGLTLLVVPPIALLATVARRLERRMSRTASAAGATHGATHARARGDGAQP